jgi:hypothetical protein
MDLYIHSPICLHGIVLSSAQGQLYVYLSLNKYCPVYGGMRDKVKGSSSDDWIY